MEKQPHIASWQRHLIEEMADKGLGEIEVRRSSRTGSTMYRIDGSRWMPAGPASRKMEIAIYGRANP